MKIEDIEIDENQWIFAVRRKHFDMTLEAYLNSLAMTIYGFDNIVYFEEK